MSSAPTPKYESEIVNSIGMRLALIPAGEFMMGSPDTDHNAHDHEKPQHQVKISEPFYMGIYQVTQKEFLAVMQETPWKGQECVEEDDRNAASYISWEDAYKFCEDLSDLEGKTYRLPTEAEWEYACRAGSVTRYCFGDDNFQLADYAFEDDNSQLHYYAWYQDNADDVGQAYAHRVGEKRSNAFGLYDMHGNVCEWCYDTFRGKAYSRRSGLAVDPHVRSVSGACVLRGGSWEAYPRFCRSAHRGSGSPGRRNAIIGFRVVYSLR